MSEEQHRVLKTKKDYDDFLFKDPYLAFLDILGFSSLVKKNQHEVLVDVYQNIFTETTTRVDVMMKKMGESRTRKMGEQYTPSGLKMVNISDSILIWTEHGQPTALYELIFAVSSLLGISIVRGLPLRGCVTRQKFTALQTKDVTSIIGNGLVHAYNEEKIQQWSGCIVDTEIINYFKGIEKHFGRWEKPSEIERYDLVYEYELPMVDKDKKPFSRKGFAVNWFHPLITEDMVTSSFDKHNKKDERPDSDTPQKIENTLVFHRFCAGKQQQKVEEYEKLSALLDRKEE